MLCRDDLSSTLAQSLRKGFIADAVVLDVAQRQNDRPTSSDPKELYQNAIDLCIEDDLCTEEHRQEMLSELERLRDGQGLTYDQLSSVRRFFFDLGKGYLCQTDDCLSRSLVF